MGVFLVIAVSAAILVFRPNAAAVSTPEVSSINANRSATTDTSALVRDDTFRGLQDPAAASPIQENTINAYGSSGMAADNKGEAAGTVISVPKPSTAAVPDVKPAPAAKPAAQVKAAPVEAKPAAVKAAPPPKKAQRDYWVQAGSFSTRERADGVKGTLDTKGLSAIVTNQDINGNTYYRVRVGPYSSQNEADYWLAMIKSIDGFQESQIWESQSFR